MFFNEIKRNPCKESCSDTEFLQMEIKIGTRGSTLALAQTTLVVEALRSVHPAAHISHVVVQTQGDRKQGTPEARIGDKEDWIKELELTLLSGEIDAALHSGKDIPSECHSDTVFIPVLKRGFPHDAFVGKRLSTGKRIRFDELEAGSVIGTASLRRQALILEARPDLKVEELRGNVPTRLGKLDESESLSGLVLAAAGFERLGFTDLEYELLDTEWCVPAVSQGMLVMQVMKDRGDVQGVVGPLCDPDAFAVWQVEREIARVLEGDCNSAMGIFAEVVDGVVKARAKVLSVDGKQGISFSCSGSRDEAVALGARIGQDLLDKGAKALLKNT